MSEVRYQTDQIDDSGEPFELVIQFVDDGLWRVGTASIGEEPASWVIIDPETAPASVSSAIADLFHGIEATT